MLRLSLVAFTAGALAAVPASYAHSRAAETRTPPDAASAHAPTKAKGKSLATRKLSVTARNYAFDMPDTVPAGRTEITLKNDGPELHHVQLIRLAQGKRMSDFMKAMQAGGPPPAWIKEVGGPNTPVPGQTAVTTVDLTAGNYVAVCFIPSPDGKPHIMKGMMKELTVVAPRARDAKPVATKTADVTMTLTDYAFTLSAPLTAGEHLVRVKNVAVQAHEVLFVKLAPGKKVGDVAAWIEKMDGPPPGAPIGGTVGIAQGGSNDVAVTLEPGEYGLLCFFPDAKDGKPHVMHGMMKQLTVK